MVAKLGSESDDLGAHLKRQPFSTQGDAGEGILEYTAIDSPLSNAGSAHTVKLHMHHTRGAPVCFVKVVHGKLCVPLHDCNTGFASVCHWLHVRRLCKVCIAHSRLQTAGPGVLASPDRRQTRAISAVHGLDGAREPAHRAGTLQE